MGIPERPGQDGLVLRPFRGVRFTVEDPAKVTSPPYDLISDADVRTLLDLHPNNVVRLILPCSAEIDSATTSSTIPPQQDAKATTAPATGRPGDAERQTAGQPSRPEGDGEQSWPCAPLTPSGRRPLPATAPLHLRYVQARDTLRAWLEAGVLVPDEEPALYVYEQSGPGTLQRGLIGDVGLRDPADHVILPHEDVMPGPVADRLALMSTTQANLEPIFLLYDGGYGAATRLVDETADNRPPLVEARTEDGLTHRLWAITDPAEIAAINADLHDRQALIADGHHRYATYRVLQRQEQTTHEQPTTSQSPTPPASPAESATPAEPGTSPLRPTADESRPPQSDRQAEGRTSHEGVGTSPTGDNAPPGGSEPGEGGGLTKSGELANSGRRGEDASPQERHRPVAGPWDFGLALLVDSSAYPPVLKAIHRVIPGLPLREAAAKAKGAWRVEDFPDLAQGLAALKDAPDPAFLLAGAEGAHLLTSPDPLQLARAMPADRSDRWNSLNTSILSEFVLPKVWGMQDDEQAVRIVHHDAEAALRVAVSTGGTAVILKPLAVEDVLAVAAGGERVPRKSTSFGPKPRTGLVLRTFAID
ncbi:DUF1015 family protein [Nonomuraea pusilla]|uniref:DUF1015 family protein n=1 Tax=Nonomuraea pusilla TaxID=46177 RepID=UPI00210D6492|nr:DUF1015 domain-containing protein [Nonomuraea pusilla]